MIDVDNFKSFNDTYGHDIGDEILKLLTKAYDSAIRGDDFIGRWGGEEFLAIFKNVDETQLMMILERLRMLVENSSLRTHEPHLKVTISIGGTLFKHGDTIDSLFKRVDELMYTSKSNGRNRVTIDK
jgi:diguanylate cyclase (GGDEF)-like protein